MPLILVIGDFAIPFLAHEIHPKFKSLLVPGKLDKVLCTGNLCTVEILQYLRSVCPDTSVVRGQLDVLSTDFPEEMTVQVGNFRIGLTHGHQILPLGSLDAAATLSRRLDVDILITGQSPTFRAHRLDNRIILSPGSATGCMEHSQLASEASESDRAASQLSSSSTPPSPGPSFVLLDVDGSRCSVFYYHLTQQGEVKVDKLTFLKD